MHSKVPESRSYVNVIATIIMEQEETLKKMYLSLALMVVMVSWLCPDFQAHQIINIKYIPHATCHSYLNEVT